LSPPIPVTYKQLDTYCTQLTSGLVHLGLTDPSVPVASRPRVSIYADTCLNWQLMSQSFAILGHVITTAYTTLGEEGLLTSLVEPDVQLVFCGEAQLGMVRRVVERAKTVRYVVYDGEDRVDKVGPFQRAD
jgi:long-chain acyl-CoA synthetase